MEAYLVDDDIKKYPIVHVQIILKGQKEKTKQNIGLMLRLAPTLCVPSSWALIGWVLINHARLSGNTTLSRDAGRG